MQLKVYVASYKFIFQKPYKFYAQWLGENEGTWGVILVVEWMDFCSYIMFDGNY